MLYVRQSSAHQVLHKLERARALQYAMRDRLTSLGWRQIETIDDGLGRSAPLMLSAPASSAWWPKVCLGKVGAVAALEISLLRAQQP